MDYSDEVIKENGSILEGQNLFTKVFSWMFIGLIITAITAFITANSIDVIEFVYANQIVIWGLIIAEVVLVIVLSANAHKMSFGSAVVCYIGYAVINGLMFSSVLLVYDMSLVSYAFGSTALMFGGMAAYGYFTKSSLTGIGSIAGMALWGLIVATIINVFIGSSGLDTILIYLGIIIFVGLTAYDVQKIKRMAETYPNFQNLAIIGALTLYLDFINLFLKVLRLLTKRRD